MVSMPFQIVFEKKEDAERFANACIRISEIMTVCIQEMKRKGTSVRRQGEGTCQSGGAVHFPQKVKGALE